MLLIHLLLTHHKLEALGTSPQPNLPTPVQNVHSHVAIPAGAEEDNMPDHNSMTICLLLV